MAPGKAVGKPKRQTPSSQRKKANIRRGRKHAKKRSKEREPSWVEALKNKYDKSGKQGPGDKKKPWQRRSKPKPIGDRALNRGYGDGDDEQDFDEDDEDFDRLFGGAANDDDDEDLPKSKANKREKLAGKKRSRRELANEAAEEGEHEDDVEVESDLDEEKIKELNERQPLESQLFLKGLPMDADEELITEIFKSYGKVMKVHVVRNQVTKMASGTAFVHFKTSKFADAAFAVATQNARELIDEGRKDFARQSAEMTHHQAKKAQYRMRQEKFTLKDPFVLINGARVTVLRVLSRMESQDLTSGGKDRKKANRTVVGADDPRNLYLLQEGRISKDSAAAKELNPKYLTMLENDYESRVQQLKNVNMFVSKNRLSIRNIPRDVDSAGLRKFCLDSVRDFIKKHPDQKEKKLWGKFGPVKNCRILLNNQGLSKGFGFVEFVKHEFALAALRQLNNNPTLFGKNHRLVVNFAIENVNALQKMERLKELRKARAAQKANAGLYDAEDGEDDENEKKTYAGGSSQAPSSSSNQGTRYGSNALADAAKSRRDDLEQRWGQKVSRHKENGGGDNKKEKKKAMSGKQKMRKHAMAKKVKDNNSIKRRR